MGKIEGLGGFWVYKADSWSSTPAAPQELHVPFWSKHVGEYVLSPLGADGSILQEGRIRKNLDAIKTGARHHKAIWRKPNKRLCWDRILDQVHGHPDRFFLMKRNITEDVLQPALDAFIAHSKLHPKGKLLQVDSGPVPHNSGEVLLKNAKDPDPQPAQELLKPQQVQGSEAGLAELRKELADLQDKEKKLRTKTSKLLQKQSKLSSTQQEMLAARYQKHRKVKEKLKGKYKRHKDTLRQKKVAEESLQRYLAS